MSQPFDHIKRELGKFGGQPYVDDSNVTVAQILALTLEGKSLSDILEQFPKLTDEDIHQALGFVVYDMTQAISYWRHDGMTPLTQIKGYSEILVGKTEFDDLDTIPTEQKNQWLSIIHSSSQRGIASWQLMSQWMSKRYSINNDNETEVLQLEKFINDLVSIAQGNEPSLSIRTSPYNDQIKIDVHPDTALILGQLLSYAKNTFKPEVKIELSENKNNISLKIEREFSYPDDDIQKLVNTPYNPIATAITFFYQIGHKFAIDYQDDSISYTIKLGIWND